MTQGKPTTEPGIYVISNRVDGKVYVGQARNPRKRWTTHLCALRKNRHDNSKLQRAFNKHGEAAFTFTVIEVCPEDALTEREQFFIEGFNAVGIRGYNLSPCANSTAGFRMSPEQKLRLSEKKRKIGCTANMLEALRKNAKARKGRKRPPETADKIAQANRDRCSGIPKSVDTRRKLSQALTGRTKDPELVATVNEKISGERSVHWIKDPTPQQLKTREYNQRRRANLTDERKEELRKQQRARRARERELKYNQSSAIADHQEVGPYGDNPGD